MMMPIKSPCEELAASVAPGAVQPCRGPRVMIATILASSMAFIDYSSQAVIKGGKKDDPIGRLPGPVIEAAVAGRILKFLESPIEILDAIKRLDVPGVHYGNVLKLARQRASEWSRMPPPGKADLIRSMLHRVIVHDGSIELQLNVESIPVFQEKQSGVGVGDQHIQTFSLRASFCHVAQGKSLKLVIFKGL